MPEKQSTYLTNLYANVIQSKPYIWAWQVFIVAILYYLFGKLAFSISVANGIVTNVPFFAEGIGLSTTILWGLPAAIGIFSGQLLLALHSGVVLVPAIGISITNAALALFGRYIFQKLQLNKQIETIRDITYLSALILFVIQPLSAIIGNYLLFKSMFSDPAGLFPMIITWWLGNSIGQLPMVPFVLFIFARKYKLPSLLREDVPVALVALIITFLIFRVTNYIDSSLVLATLMFLLPITLIISTQKKPETVVLALLFMTISAFFAISANIIELEKSNKSEIFMRLDLLIISLQLSGMIISVLISNLKKAQEKLHINQLRLNGIINTTLVGFTILNSKGIHLYANKNAMTIHGFNSDEIIGMHFSKIVHPMHHQSTEKLIELIISGEKEYIDTEALLVHKNSQKNVWIHVIATKYPRIEETDEESILIVFHDLTLLKEQEQRLLELNITKDKFVSIIAHDLKNSFNALIGFSEFLKADLKNGKTERLESYAHALYDTSTNTYALLENLLKWAKLQQGKMAYSPVNSAVSQFIHECVFSTKGMALAKNIVIKTEVPDHLYVFADVEMLHTILRNLVTNAIKFTHKNGTITITANLKNQLVEFQVKDNGVGMSEATKNALFQIDISNTGYGTEGEKGTGLGLILCKEFIEMHNGEIWVESTVNEGSTFKFTIPAGISSK